MEPSQNLQEEAKQAFISKDWKKASSLYRHLATLGSQRAWLQLGQMYEFGGNGIEASGTESVHWYKRAWDERQLVRAGLALGRIYYLGRGVPIDYEKAFRYYSEFADTRDPTGLFMLGLLYQKGLGTPEDIKKALFYYGRSAKMGSVFARKNYAVLKFKQGNVVVGIVYWIWASSLIFWFLMSKTKSPRLHLI